MDLKISIDYHEYFISSSCYTHFLTGKQQCNLIVNAIQSKIHIEIQIRKTSSKFNYVLSYITIWEHCEAWFECKRNVHEFTINSNLKAWIYDWIVCSHYQMFFFNLNHASFCLI